MDRLIRGNTYKTPAGAVNGKRPLWPTLAFHSRMLIIHWTLNRLAVKGLLNRNRWTQNCLDILRALEGVGVRFEIDNLNVLYRLSGPRVYIGNHMSSLETFILPCLVQPACDTTFIVKESLIRFPVFGPVIRSADPITIGRKSPREDFKVVLKCGKEHLESGTSIIVFPQTTRSTTFNPTLFNTIGVKLARHAKVPVVPIALKTDAWEKGRIIKDFGPIKPDRKVYICFGEPLEVSGTGKKEHEKVVDFIQGKLGEWGEKTVPVV